MAEIGVVIVTYSSDAQIGPCLDSVLPFGADVVVVDNGRSAAVAAETERRGVTLIANESNRGFAAAVNQGFAVLNSEYVLLLNPDARVEGGLSALRAACDLPRAAGAGGLLLDESGSPQVGFMVRFFPTPAIMILESCLLNRIWPNNPWNRRYRGVGLDYSRPMTVEQPAGAFLMVRREAWRKLGGFDEGFFPLWFEDVDFCRRAVQEGYLLYYEPGAVAKHTGGHSIERLAMESRRVYWYGSLLRYAAKHFGPGAFRTVCAAVLTGSFLRMIAESAFYRSLKPWEANWKVARLAGRCLVSGLAGKALLEPPR